LAAIQLKPAAEDRGQQSAPHWIVAQRRRSPDAVSTKRWKGPVNVRIPIDRRAISPLITPNVVGGFAFGIIDKRAEKPDEGEGKGA
jgi:hypothetical protein